MVAEASKHLLILYVLPFPNVFKNVTLMYYVYQKKAPTYLWNNY